VKSPDIDAVDLISVSPIDDGSRLKLRVRARDGGIQTVAMPARWLNDLVNAVPHPMLDGSAHPLASWSMQAAAGGELLLTLRTPEGEAFSFTMKPWQVQGMGTLATHGHFETKKKDALH
jgi:hypothetical protein